MPKYVDLQKYSARQIAAIVEILRERKDLRGLPRVAVRRATFAAIEKSMQKNLDPETATINLTIQEGVCEKPVAQSDSKRKADTLDAEPTVLVKRVRLSSEDGTQVPPNEETVAVNAVAEPKRKRKGKHQFGLEKREDKAKGMSADALGAVPTPDGSGGLAAPDPPLGFEPSSFPASSQVMAPPPKQTPVPIPSLRDVLSCKQTETKAKKKAKVEKKAKAEVHGLGQPHA